MNKIKIYKIRDKKTGLFSKGGTNTTNLWSKEGKSWSNIGYIKNHLNQFIDNGVKRYDYPYENAEIIVIEVSYEDVMKIYLNDITNEIIDLRLKEKEAYELIKKEKKEEDERKLYKKLHEKFGK